MRHNHLRDVHAELLREVCRDVVVEPVLLPLTGEKLHYKTANRSPEARADISARGIWNPLDKAFFDIQGGPQSSDQK